LKRQHIDGSDIKSVEALFISPFGYKPSQIEKYIAFGSVEEALLTIV
jgi:hypothetical protein